MGTRICVDCLVCGHCRSFSEAELGQHGFAPGGSLVTLTKHLVCTRCGGRAVRAFRMPDDAEHRDMLHESLPPAPNGAPKGDAG